MHQKMKRVLVMIAVSPDGMKASDEICLRQRGIIHKQMSMPSYAISNPAFSTSRCSTDSSLRIGLVLLMCTRILRVGASAGNCASNPSGPDRGRCPISRAVLLLRPVRINSSSDQNVPSSMTTFAEEATLLQAVSLPGKEGAINTLLP